MDFNKLLLPVPRTSVMKQEGYIVWCGTIAKADDGLYYLLFSRWPNEAGFDGWVTNSEICWAVSDNPYGGFKFGGVALTGSGDGSWDSDCVHNPTVIAYKGKYYLYYMGNRGNGQYWNHRNNQRIGLAIANHPAGPWTRIKKPIIDVTKGSFDHLMTSNPTVTIGRYGEVLMIYKAVGDGEMPKGGKVVCAVAKAKHPRGPFVKNSKPIMVNPENDWSVEDPFVWFQNNRYYSLVKDFQGYFTKKEAGSAALFESRDGDDWEPSEHPFAFGLSITWEDGIQAVKRLERPQIYFEGGKPLVLCCAVCCNDSGIGSYNVQIPLRQI
ncbi:MAG: glycoside hydrolase family protein [Eubacteriales bacterium]|jgi:hypothetical protein|nr:glycoside hydrolase family protein [Eubacteriales bacterium]